VLALSFAFACIIAIFIIFVIIVLLFASFKLNIIAFLLLVRDVCTDPSAFAFFIGGMARVAAREAVRRNRVVDRPTF
jgi:hypothetical protein